MRNIAAAMESACGELEDISISAGGEELVQTRSPSSMLSHALVSELLIESRCRGAVSDIKPRSPARRQSLVGIVIWADETSAFPVHFIQSIASTGVDFR